MKDGSKREFPHKIRPGGSYTNSVKYEGAFVIITDPWCTKIALPAADVAEVKEWQV